MTKLLVLSIILAIAWLLYSKPTASALPALSSVRHAEWARGSVIYELNTRQFTKEGTFRAVLPRVQELRDLGIGIVWFMPIHPIGERNRKGDLGSPYAVRDYHGVNSEFGTLEDFKACVQAIHAAGMHVIIDLVANHTAWDNPLATQHPDWFVHDKAGHFVPPVPNWTDVIKLDYGNAALREYMLGVMEYWVRDVGIDGFRCDVASMVPTSFWNEARRRLDRIKPVFMLAEAEKPELLVDAFDCDYASEFFRAFDAIGQGTGTPAQIDRLLADDRAHYPRGSWRMMFTTNHDQNSWLDSDQRRLGEKGSRTFAVLAFTLPGQPLIYNGQEIAIPNKLAFFSRDPIDWVDPNGTRAFYKSLCELYHSYSALQNGGMCRLKSNVYAYRRDLAGSRSIVVAANLSSRPVEASLPVLQGAALAPLLPSSASVPVHGGQVSFPLPPWGSALFAVEQ